MSTIKAILLKPLDGQAEGTERDFDKVDFDNLVTLGAVRAVSEKAAEPPLNKMAVAPINKAAPTARNKT